MLIGGVKIDRVPGLQHKAFIVKHKLHASGNNKVKLLTGVADQRRRGIRRIQCDQKRLHDFAAVAESQILKRITGITVNRASLSVADNMVGIKLGTGTGHNLRKIHTEFVGNFINDTNGNVFAVFFIFTVHRRIQVQFCRKFFLCVAAGLAQTADTLRQFLQFIHIVHMAHFRFIV